MNTERIKEIQQETRYPESVSVQQALLKVWNETEQQFEAVQYETIVTLLHDEAEKLEKQGLTQGKIGNTHAMHGKMDTARCFRITANTLSGDQAG